MYKLWATILKDLRILTRDKVGLILMFAMPIILAIVLTATQNSTFNLVNKNKIPLLLCNKDNGEASQQLVSAIEKAGMFDVKKVSAEQIEDKARAIATKALNNFGVQTDTVQQSTGSLQPISLLYHPVLQESFRHSIQGALRSSLQMVQSKQVLQSIYYSLNETKLPDSLEAELLTEEVAINEIPISRDGSKTIPNATQHNIPAWTIFAMFFVVISLGSSVVREKLNGSFVRLKTLPTNYLLALLSKQITYLFVTLLQAAVIFSIGIWLFPSLGLPRLNLPADLLGLLVVTFICGYCAVSFAIAVGVFARTQEQANGIGAVSVVLMAAIGGLLVPAFAMPASFQPVIKLSPLHWGLEAYYGLFLEAGTLKDILVNILPLLGITVFIQLIALYGLKRKNLI